jgi:hypothetical protein
MEWRRGELRPWLCQPQSATDEIDLVSKKARFKRSDEKILGALNVALAVID